MRSVMALAGVVSLVVLCQGGGVGEKGKAKKAKPRVTKVAFGKTKDGTEVDLYTLTNKNGVVAKVMTYGATLTELRVPDKDGKLTDVVLGFDDVAGYEGKANQYFGCTVGRVANRVANGRFTLDGKEYKLAQNNKPHTLHGGDKGFDKVVWGSLPARRRRGSQAVSLTYTSPDGEESFPGRLRVSVVYRLSDKDELTIGYTATTDKATPVNLTNHAYFNLAGHETGDILGHEVTIFAAKYTPADDTLIPTGKIEPVKGTPFDFTRPTAIGARIDQLKGDPGGYDVNYVLDSGGGKLTRAARVRDPKSGRVMEVLTTEPGLQFYSGNFLNGTAIGKGGAVYKKHAAFCLEAQHFPDSVHHKEFPSIILRPGETYKQTTVYRFRAK
jgi:aldose 1-epimerase